MRSQNSAKSKKLLSFETLYPHCPKLNLSSPRVEWCLKDGTEVSTVRDSLRGSHRLSTSIVWCENGAVSIAYIVLSIDFISTLYREADQQNCNRWKRYSRQGSHPATWKHRWCLRTRPSPKSYSHVRRCENVAVSIAYIVLSIDFISTLYREADQQNCNRWKRYSRQGSHPATWKHRWCLRTRPSSKSYSHVRLYTLIALRLSESWVR